MGKCWVGLYVIGPGSLYSPLSFPRNSWHWSAVTVLVELSCVIPLCPVALNINHISPLVFQGFVRVFFLLLLLILRKFETTEITKKQSWVSSDHCPHPTTLIRFLRGRLVPSFLSFFKLGLAKYLLICWRSHQRKEWRVFPIWSLYFCLCWQIKASGQNKYTLCLWWVIYFSVNFYTDSREALPKFQFPTIMCS